MPGRPFERGKSGNPTGRPKIDKTLQELARAHCPEAIRTLVSIMKDDAAPPAARAMCANAIMDRGHGKPPQALEHTGKDGKPIELLDVTDEARARALAALMARTKTKEPG